VLYHVGVNAHRERGRTFWIVMVALAALVAGLATAISQWRAQRPGPAGVEVPAPADTGESIIGQALAQIPVDSTALKNRWLDSVRGVDVAGLTPAQRALFVRVANSYRCTCGCGFTLATCRAYDAQCPVSGPRVRALRDSVRAGLVSARGLRQRPKDVEPVHPGT